MDSYSERAIRKKFPRIRCKREFPPSPRDPNPDPPNHPAGIQPKTPTHLCSDVPVQDNHRQSDSFNLEQLRSLSPGRYALYEELGHSSTFDKRRAVCSPVPTQREDKRQLQSPDSNVRQYSMFRQSIGRTNIEYETKKRCSPSLSVETERMRIDNGPDIRHIRRDNLYIIKNPDIIDSKEFNPHLSIEKVVHINGTHKNGGVSHHENPGSSTTTLSHRLYMHHLPTSSRQPEINDPSSSKIGKVHPSSIPLYRKRFNKRSIDESVIKNQCSSQDETNFNEFPESNQMFNRFKWCGSDTIQQEIPECSSPGRDTSRYSDLSSCPTSPDTVVSSDESSQQCSPTRHFQSVGLNEFQSAHYELLLETPIPTTPKRFPPQSTTPAIGEPPELIPLSADVENNCDEDYFSDGVPTEDEKRSILPDTSRMTAEAILELIREPSNISSSYRTDFSSLTSFLEPHEMGHLNHLIKCYADSLFKMYKKVTSYRDASSSTSSAVYLMDMHLCGLVQIYYMLFKSEDFLNLSIHDQGVLLECGMLPAMISLGIPLYKASSKGWALPNLTKNAEPFFLPVVEFNDLLPRSVVDRTFTIYELSDKLGLDWTVSMLFLMIFLFTPVNRYVEEQKRIDLIRTNYVKLLLKYLEWKHGPTNSSLIFPELLKLMDAILRHCQEIENIHLSINEEEIATVYEHFNSLNVELNLSNNSNKEDNENYQKWAKKAYELGYMTYYSLHLSMSSNLTRFLNSNQNLRSRSSHSSNVLLSRPISPLNLSPSGK